MLVGLVIGYWRLVLKLAGLSVIIGSRCLNSFHCLITYTVRYYTHFCMFAASVLNYLYLPLTREVSPRSSDGGRDPPAGGS
ncbi:hypothetical protein DW132_08345 [Bifidobacterium longum]|nr:hypothetical protein DW135_08235 [Bifidobacterium longum]RHJ31457.1 hypothetical protein DW132_08345 [Bifidobacterium longum]